MKRILKSVISTLLVLSVLLSTPIAASAMYKVEEEYISELRLIYAETYEEAKQIAHDCAFTDYRVLNHNLNAYTGRIGVWLAYKPTKNIDEAITDMAVMQMGGGYSAANYQAMIEGLRGEYLAMGETYIQAIDYFTEAYDAGDFLADAAYRQLNFYAGYDKYPEERLGDLFADGILRVSDAANLFFESSATVGNNIRTLLAMGVSYNEDGMHYLERVNALVADRGEGVGLKAFSGTDVEIYVRSDSELKTLAKLIAPNILVFRSMFRELSAYEAELDYRDENVTELELKYAEYKAIAEKMRAVNYIDGQTLYDFCLNYELNTSDFTSLYPLAVALNAGQIPMTQLAHYYDIVRYSMSEYPEESINREITELEERYIDDPFDIYTGVDRSLFDNTFALTPEAYRTNAYDNSNALGESLFGGLNLTGAGVHMNMGTIGVRFSVWAIVRGNSPAEIAEGLCQKAADQLEANTLADLKELENTSLDGSRTYGEYVEQMYLRVEQELGENMWDDFAEAWNASEHMYDKVMALITAFYAYELPTDVFNVSNIQSVCLSVRSVVNEALQSGQEQAVTAFSKLYNMGMDIWSIYSGTKTAISLYERIRDHYYPKYDEVPLVMVDVVSTEKGYKYIRYDAVREVMTKNGECPAADLNAYKAERWNALYYTKNADAGKPLLADFEISNDNNRAEEGYLPIHRFGEGICYDLNRYNFSSNSAMIFLSVRQSEKQKYDLTTAPQIVGAIFGERIWIFSGFVGVVIGAGCTMAVRTLLKKKKNATKTNCQPVKEENQ